MMGENGGCYQVELVVIAGGRVKEGMEGWMDGWCLIDKQPQPRK